VYIPPEGLFYGSLETFDVIESNIVEINSQFDNTSFVMLGDVNAGTSNLSDFVNVDPFISDITLENLANHILSVNNLCDLGSVVWHHSLLLMNGFNKTEVAVFSDRICFLRAFPFIIFL